METAMNPAVNQKQTSNNIAYKRVIIDLIIVTLHDLLHK